MTKGYFEFDYLKRRDLNDEVQKVMQNSLNLYNSVTGTVDYFANLPSASANLNKIWLVRFATTVLGIITKQAGLYISNGTNWNWMTSLEAKAEKNTTISAGNGLTGGGDLSANRTISHNDTSSQDNIVNTGGNVIQSANLDDFGHITSFSSIDLDNRYITTSGAYANPTWITSLDANKLTGTIPSNVLGASTLYIGTTEIALNRASANQALTGISSVQFTGATSGTATIQAPAVAGTTTFTLPTTSGNLITDQEYTANDVLTKIKTVDGAGSGLDADLLNGLSLNLETGAPVWPYIPFITNSGVIEVGRYIDFHASSSDGNDYTARLDAGSAATPRTLSLPTSSGTLVSTGGTGVVTNTMLAQITQANKVANSATTATVSNTANALVTRDNSGNFLANFVKFRLVYEGNDAFAVVNTTSTLTATQLNTLVIESTPTADITLTLPTGTTLEGAAMGSLATNASFTWSIVNIATGFKITMAGNTGSTYTGNAVISANSSASFRTQKTAANTFKTVRI